MSRLFQSCLLQVRLLQHQQDVVGVDGLQDFLSPKDGNLAAGDVASVTLCFVLADLNKPVAGCLEFGITAPRVSAICCRCQLGQEQQAIPNKDDIFFAVISARRVKFDEGLQDFLRVECHLALGFVGV